MNAKFRVGQKVRIVAPKSLDNGIEAVVLSAKDVEGDITYLIETLKLGRALVMHEGQLEEAWI